MVESVNHGQVDLRLPEQLAEAEESGKLRFLSQKCPLFHTSILIN